jgi:hypothetical protein
MIQITIGLATAGVQRLGGLWRVAHNIVRSPPGGAATNLPLFGSVAPPCHPLPWSLLREHQLRGHVRSGYEHNQDERSSPSQLDQMRIRVFTESVNEFC